MSAPSWVEESSDTPSHSLADVLHSVATAIAPVWPLKDYVAVNPYMGLSDRSFLKARQILRLVCDSDTLMPLSYYQRRFDERAFDIHDIEFAVQEINAEDSLSRLTAATVIQALEDNVQTDAERNSTATARKLQTLAEYTDQRNGTMWAEVIRDEIGRHCGAYYDEGQAVWASPWKDQPLFQAWQSAARYDRRMELSGVAGCCRFLATVPDSAEAAIAFLLNEIGMPEELWEPFLLCQAHSIPGWSAWAKYKTEQSSNDNDSSDFVSLLAIRLAYDVAVAKSVALRIDWKSVSSVWKIGDRSVGGRAEQDVRIRFSLLRASEVAFQRQLLNSLSIDSIPNNDEAAAQSTPLAQMIFCIDVRSERYRRHLESVAQPSTGVQTFGFAGFFGMPIGFQNFGEQSATPQAPALLSPSFVVQEGVRGAAAKQTTEMHNGRSLKRRFRNSWKNFSSSATGCFGFVETSGIAYGWKLFRKSLNQQPATTNGKFDGIAEHDRSRLSPTFENLEQQGIDLSKQIDIAESALRGIGLTKNFAKLVVFCGHGSQVENNPLQAGLDCGACCGHSGEPNARFAAAVLNQPSVRTGLAERGIHVPNDTRFVAALHNTTNDRITFFETDLLTESQQQAMTELNQRTAEATRLTQIERLPQLKANNVADVMQRTLDWSEVRPEWGLSGNAAFIVAPRHVTQNANLDGRSFLHSYDHQTDPGFQVLEQIMTAPMVVGHWINMQYYASTLDNKHYGSGSKTIHNVVGKFGVFSGNGGDLMTGLPWQSIHNGQNFQHEPLRLLAVIAAPRAAVADIINRQELLQQLFTNGWLHLIVIEDGESYRYTTQQNWQPVSHTSCRI